MHAVVTRFFWVVIGLAVASCALFAAKLANHAVAGEMLADAAHGPPIARAAAAPPEQAELRAAKDGAPIVLRNMFCSECTPPVDDPGPAPPPVDPSIIPLTALPLRLVATHVADGRHAARDSLAFILDTSSSRQGAYAIGQQLRGAGPVVAIHHQHVDFHNDATRRVERIALVPDAAPRDVAPPPPRPDATAAAVEGIRAVDGSTFEVDHAVIEKALANPMAFARDARLVPSTSKDGKADGFRVVSVRAGSAAAALGLTRGDTIHAINGITLDSMDQVMNAFTELRDAKNLELELTRAGKPASLRYLIH